MIEQIVLLVNRSELPPTSVWQDATRHIECVVVTDEWSVQTDAALVSVFRCEPYGCRAGTSDSTLGVMYIFDTWQFEPPNAFYPRILISNAVWRSDPPLEEAIKQRLQILAEAIAAYNEIVEIPIKSITVECSALGMWQDYPRDVQHMAISYLGSLLAALLPCE